jgi:predicted DsbA family dithiol-disulfide isomerase
MRDNPIVIDHFSDLLCVWAYVAQIRVDELNKNFTEQVRFHYHFIPVFGVVEERVGEGWKEKGGYAGFGHHVLEVCKQFPHVELNHNVWRGDVPKSSANAHLFLKAAQLLPESERRHAGGRSLFEELAWQLRLAFFRDNKNIAQLSQQLPLAEALGLPSAQLIDNLHSGAAMAALCRDSELCKQYGVGGSPSYVLNQGRQKLYGNVGYKVIAANVQEVLHQPGNQASWC